MWDAPGLNCVPCYNAGAGQSRDLEQSVVMCHVGPSAAPCWGVSAAELSHRGLLQRIIMSCVAVPHQSALQKVSYTSRTRKTVYV
jgi:hypothetical protein